MALTQALFSLVERSLVDSSHGLCKIASHDDMRRVESGFLHSLGEHEPRTQSVAPAWISG